MGEGGGEGGPPSPASPPLPTGRQAPREGILRSYHFLEINLKFSEIVSLTFFIKGPLSFEEQ